MPFVKPPTDPQEIIFRPYSSGGGVCFHANEAYMRCDSQMRGIRDTLEQAQRRHLRPCKKCFGDYR